LMYSLYGPYWIPPTVTQSWTWMSVPDWPYL